LTNLFIEYNSVSNNKVEVSDKVNFIKNELEIKNDFPLLLLGIVNDFLVSKPQKYYNKEVEHEVFSNLNILYNKDREQFIKSFYLYQDRFFHSINSYYNILEQYKEFNNVSFDLETKTKIYTLPVITQLMEFCLSHFYRGIASIIGDIKGKNYVAQDTLRNLEELLLKTYPNLLNIDIEFRNAISHGGVQIYPDKLVYFYNNKERETIQKELSFSQLEEMKNKLIDILSGAFVGYFKFIIENNIIDSGFMSEDKDKNTFFELIKLFLRNENTTVNSLYEEDNQIKLYLSIRNIDDVNKIKYLTVLIGKILFRCFNRDYGYENYLIYYTHPYSLGGMITFKDLQLKNILLESDVSKWHTILDKDSLMTFPEIGSLDLDYSSYKFYRFPDINDKNWYVENLTDISEDNIKHFDARLIIENKNISKQEIMTLLFQVTQRIMVLENKVNPKQKIKHGKIEADAVTLKVFYETKNRNSFSLQEENKSFICIVNYIKKESYHKLIAVPFGNHYEFEHIKKLNIYWNKNFIENH
jgi:hypothetical protein